MRLSGHLGLSAPDRPLLAHLGRSVDPLDQIDALADHGFVGVQDLFLKLRPLEEQTAMARKMDQRGMALSSFGGDPFDWNKPLWSAADDAGRQAVAASVALSCDLARLFGGAGVVCVAGLDPARARDEQLAAMTENLKRHAEEAARAGLVLLVEPIAESRIPNLLLNEMEMGLAMVQAVAMPSVQLLFDVGHAAMMGEDVPSALATCGDAIELIQIADSPGRVDPGLGELDWAGILSGIRKLGYTGPIELEFEPVDQTVEGEAAMLARIAAIAGV